jgi:hypothetical protein
MTAPRRRYQGCLATRLKPADYENCLDNYDNNEEPKGRYPVQWHNPFAMRSALHISMSHPNSQHKNNSHATDVAEGISTNSLMAVARRTVSQCILMVCNRIGKIAIRSFHASTLFSSHPASRLRFPLPQKQGAPVATGGTSTNEPTHRSPQPKVRRLMCYRPVRRSCVPCVELAHLPPARFSP